MNVPVDQIKSLEARGFKIGSESTVMHGKIRLTVVFDGWTFSKDLTTAYPLFVVSKVEKPPSKPRKPKTTEVTSAAKASGKK